MKKMRLNYGKILSYTVYTIVIVFAILVISSKFSIGGIKLLVVKSGSMEPTIKTGSLVIDKEMGEYQVGDIVTFKNEQKPLETTTHRIVEEQKQDNFEVFATKGDANDAKDSNKIPSNLVVGKVIFKIPYLGYVVSFARTVPGLIILIVIPATIIIYEEINKIRQEIKKQKKPKKKKELEIKREARKKKND